MPQEQRRVQFSVKRVLVALAGVFAVVLALGLRYYGHYRPFADLVGGGPLHGTPPAALRIGDAVVTGRTDGRLRWRIKAASITLSDDRSRVSVQGIHDGLLLAADGSPLVALQAGQAEYQRPYGVSMLDAPSAFAGGVLSVSGGMEGRALQPGGPTLRGQTLSWNIAQGEVQSYGATTAHFPTGARAVGGMTVRASALVWHTKDATLTAPGTVSATFANGAGSVQGSGIVVDTKQGTLTLHRLHGTFLLPDTVN